MANSPPRRLPLSRKRIGPRRQLYDDGEKAKGGGDQRSDHRSSITRGGPLTLADHGVSYDEAARGAKLAALSDDEMRNGCDPGWSGRRGCGRERHRFEGALASSTWNAPRAGLG